MSLNVCSFCLAYCDNKKNKIDHYEDCPLTQEDIKCRNRIIKNMNKERSCSNCFSVGGEKGKLLACSGCSTVFYCGNKCQKEDWRKHKKDCKMLGNLLKWSKDEKSKEAFDKLSKDLVNSL
jgi:hypothetical protein